MATSPATPPHVTLHRRKQRVYRYCEDLDGVPLEMIQIPAGRFLMGSPDDELERLDREGPQHWVELPEFFIGRYPITQAQWRAVARLPQREGELDPDPSRFKGEDHPIECISWFDAVEFCARLSQKTHRRYRLPSEAEWEYACRADTTTPFHFGETLTTDVANYRGTDWEEYGWSGSYGRGPKGIDREETTEVGTFALANAFGLYDMHGNVWEWCADPWHDSYEGAPTDGSVWVDGNENGNHSQKLVRGGSWGDHPRNCRSAYRSHGAPDNGDFSLGVRVACSGPRD